MFLEGRSVIQKKVYYRVIWSFLCYFTKKFPFDARPLNPHVINHEIENLRMSLET